MRPAVPRTDEEWMLALKAGAPREREEAFDALLAKYRAPVIHFLYRLVHRREPAEDLAQEVFLRVYRARKSYRPTAKFSTWLFRIATNVALNALRDGRMRHEREMSIETLKEWSCPASVDGLAFGIQTLSASAADRGIEALPASAWLLSKLTGDTRPSAE